MTSLAHQDYTSPIQTTVNIYPKRIVFITPGGIPPEITLDDALTEFPAGSPGLEPREECGLSKFFNLGPNA
ncbi:hypothetical protein, partial [Duodenibacillus massiliensis]|uniref:hypothetical protein n=1 Tax=Duodenibacillus massiliensis TaxID=1852381 RepID=UPI002FD998E5